MNVQIRAKDITLSEHNKTHIDAAMEQFKKYGLDITSTNIVVGKVKNGVSVEFEFNIAHHSPVVINQEDKDLDAAIDLAVDRAAKALRRMHDKDVTRRGQGIKGLDVEAEETEEA
jgi:putative sigma-54 modulation protein